MQEALLKPEEAAERLNISTATLAKKRWSGKDPIPFVKMGRSVRYEPSAIAAYVAGRVRNSTSESQETPDARIS